MLEEAISAGLPESAGLDWKDRLPAIKGLANGGVPKDVAAMANAGGGVIIYGVNEENKAATGRSDKATYGEATAERYERAYKSVAVSAIHPPVFGVELVEISASPLAVAAIIPASVDGPHLIYSSDFFRAPVRNGADTVWMREGDIARMYRARFDEQRNANEALEQLYTDAASAADGERVWFVGVARPRLRYVGERVSEKVAQGVFDVANGFAARWGERESYLGYRLPGVVGRRPRVGLRRWLLPAASSMWGRRDIEVGLHQDGSVSFAGEVGGGQGMLFGEERQRDLPADHVSLDEVETGVIEVCALIRAAAVRLGLDEYEVEVGLEWAGPLSFMARDDFGHNRFHASDELRVRRFDPVRMTVQAGGDEVAFHAQVRVLSEDCLNQAGAQELTVLRDAPVAVEG